MTRSPLHRLIFGGLRRVARMSELIVPVMALAYLALAVWVVISNITEVPATLALISSSTAAAA